MFSEAVWLLRLAEFTALAYLVLIAAYTWGWKRLQLKEFAKLQNSFKLTVVVALRNESNNIETLLKSLLNQKGFEFPYQILLVDDHSTDQTAQLLEQWANAYPHQISWLQAKDKGKKAALRQAIEASDADIILTTDADCQQQPYWLASMLMPFANPEIRLMLGPVRIENLAGIFGKIQALEFNSLMGATAGSAALGLPSMANGANLAFRRETYFEVADLQNGNKYASGDDLFLMHAIKTRYGAKSIGFCYSKNAIVDTKAASSFSKFVAQRIRWASKSGGYRSYSTLIPAWIVFLFNFSLTLMLVSAFFFPWIIPVASLFLILKAMADYPLLRNVAQFFDQKKILLLFIPLSLIYPFYIVFTAFAALTTNVEWKGRKVKHSR